MDNYKSFTFDIVNAHYSGCASDLYFITLNKIVTFLNSNNAIYKMDNYYYFFIAIYVFILIY